MLKIQTSLIEKLVAKNNYLKRLVETLKSFNINYDERVKKIKEIIRALQY